MLRKGVLHMKSLLSVFIIILMVLSGFVAVAGAAEVNEENNTERPHPGSVVGKVINEKGDPLAGVLVIITCAMDSSDPEEVCKFKAETNERGYFEFKELHRGLYKLMAELEGYRPYREEVKVPAGETVELKIILKKVEEKPTQCVVFGLVFNALENEPIPGAIVAIHNERSDEKPVKTETDGEGQFKVRLPRGKYVILVEARGFEPYKEILVVDELEIKLRIPLKPIMDKEPEHNRPMLSGHIFDALTDEPIFGWVELSYGNPKVEVPQRKKMERLPEQEPKPEDKEREEREEIEEREREEKQEKEREKEPEPRPIPEPEKPGDFFLWRTYSSRDGYYEYFELPRGHYEMRVFAKGHIMYYNEINVHDEPLYIDVYLRRAPQKKPMAIITGQVIDRGTKEPIAGALVCVAPPELIRKVIQEHNLENPEQMSIDIDLDNIPLNPELVVEYSEIPEDELEPGIGKEKEMIGEDIVIKEPKPQPENDVNSKTRGDNENELKEKPIQERDEDCDCTEPKSTQVRELLRKFCTKTDEKGFFKLQIPTGKHVLLVKARGYKVFAHKFEIKPHQIMKVRVPMNPGADSKVEENERSAADSSEGSNTMDVKSSILPAASGLNSILTTILGVLFIIALMFGVLILRTRYINPKRPKKVRIQK